LSGFRRDVLRNWLIGEWLIGEWLIGEWLIGEWLIGKWLINYSLLTTHYSLITIAIALLVDSG